MNPTEQMAKLEVQRAELELDNARCRQQISRLESQLEQNAKKLSDVLDEMVAPIIDNEPLTETALVVVGDGEGPCGPDCVCFPVEDEDDDDVETIVFVMSF